MATDTAPPPVPAPPAAPDPPESQLPGGPMGEGGVLASLLRPVEPARPTPDAAVAPSVGPGGTCAPGSSADYHGTRYQVDRPAAGARGEQPGIIRAFALAAAARWAKGGGAKNKRLDLEKARVQARQVKEARQVTVNHSSAPLPRRSPASDRNGKTPESKGDKAAPKGDVKGPQKSNGSAQNSSGGRSGNGGGRGSAGAGADGSKGSSGSSKGGSEDKGGGRGKSGAGDSKKEKKGGVDGATKGSKKDATNGSSGGATKERRGLSGLLGRKDATGGGKQDATGGGKGASKGGVTGGAGDKKSGASGGASGGGKKDPLRKDGGASAGGGRNGAGSKGDGKAGSGKRAQQGSGASGAGGSGSKGAGKDGGLGKQGKDGKVGKDSGSGASGKQQGTGAQGADGRTPLQRSREIGHGDGSKARRVADHVVAYGKGVKDGWNDEKDKNAREHDRLDKAHDKHKAKPQGGAQGGGAGDPKAGASGHKPADLTKPDTKTSGPGTGAPLQATVQGQKVTITDDDAPMEDPFMSKPTPIQAKGIDADKITLGDGFLKTTVSRGELRRYKDYEIRLESRIDGLARVADATKQLAVKAREQADDCQKLAEAAKGVEGGEKLVGQLQKLAEAAKTQANEADEIRKRAARAHDFGKGVLSNIQTRYEPLYQAVVDSDEVMPAELKFYKDRGVTPSDLTTAA